MMRRPQSILWLLLLVFLGLMAMIAFLALVAPAVI